MTFLSSVGPVVQLDEEVSSDEEGEDGVDPAKTSDAADKPAESELQVYDAFLYFRAFPKTEKNLFFVFKLLKMIPAKYHQCIALESQYDKILMTKFLIHILGFHYIDVQKYMSIDKSGHKRSLY